jgi:hypothetical protein
MAKIKYFATDADGNVHTRSSARGYTHTVVAKYSLEGLLAESRCDRYRRMQPCA